MLISSNFENLYTKQSKLKHLNVVFKKKFKKSKIFF